MIDEETNTIISSITMTEINALEVNTATNKLYGINVSTGDVMVIDGATDSSVKTISTPLGTGVGIVADTVTNKIYVLETQGLVTIDGATYTILATLPLADNPFALSINQVTRKIYVAYSGDGDTDFGGLLVVDGLTNSFVNLNSGIHFQTFVINPVTNRIYLISALRDRNNDCDGSLWELDGNDISVIGYLPLNCPMNLAVTPLTNTIFVVNTLAADSGPGPDLTAVNGETMAIKKKLDLTNEPSFKDGVFSGSIIVNSATNTVYLANIGLPTFGNPFPKEPVESVIVVNGSTLNKRTVNLNITDLEGGIPALAFDRMTNSLYVFSPRYISETGERTNMTVIDASVNGLARIATGREPVAVAVNSVTDRIYSVDTSGGTVTVVRGGTNQVLATVPVAAHPVAAAINPVTNRAYIASSGSDLITVIDGNTNTPMQVHAGSGPYSSGVPQALAVNPVTDKIYATNYASGNVTVLDGATNKTPATVPTGLGPFAVAVNATTNKIYVANVNDTTITVIEGKTNQTTTVTVGSGPRSVAVDPVANKVYVANSGSDSISIIDGARDTTSTVQAKMSPYSVAVNSRTNVIYALNRADGSVTVIDGVTHATTTVPAGNGAFAVAVNEVTNKAYVTNTINRTLTVIDGAINNAKSVKGTMSYVSKLRVPVADADGFAIPYAIAVNAATNKVYVADKSGALIVVNVDRNQSVPLTTALAGVGDGKTVSTQNVFQTKNAAPSFTAVVTSKFAETTVYSGVEGAGNPPPTALYYQVDGGGEWKAATPVHAAGTTNPAHFTISLSGQTIGPHTLYTYAAFGSGRTSTDNIQLQGARLFVGTSSELGYITTINFQIDPVF